MSMKLARYVMNYSEHKGSARFVHLVYAIHADHDDIARPYIETVAEMAQISVRHAKRIRAKLIQNDDLEPIENTEYKECYRVKMHDTHVANDDTRVIPTMTPMSSNDDTHVIPTMTPMSSNDDTHVIPTIYRKTMKDNRERQERSSSSSMMIGNDEDDDFNLIVRLLFDEFSVQNSDTVRGHVAEWLANYPVSHIQTAIATAKRYTPRAPLMYISGILDGENGRQRGGERTYTVPDDMREIVIH